MYFQVIQQFSRTLKNLDAILTKAAHYATTKKFDPNNFCTARIAPDMFPFSRQIQIACDVAKAAAATMSGKEAPKFPDQETTLEDLQARIRKTLNYLEGFRESDFQGTTAKTVVKVPFPAGKAMHAEDALLSRAVPNFFFHVTMTYALLRAGGVDIGKEDYLGKLNIFDA